MRKTIKKGDASEVSGRGGSGASGLGPITPTTHSGSLVLSLRPIPGISIPRLTWAQSQPAPLVLMAASSICSRVLLLFHYWVHVTVGSGHRRTQRAAVPLHLTDWEGLGTPSGAVKGRSPQPSSSRGQCTSWRAIQSVMSPCYSALFGAFASARLPPCHTWELGNVQCRS